MFDQQQFPSCGHLGNLTAPALTKLSNKRTWRPASRPKRSDLIPKVCEARHREGDAGQSVCNHVEHVCTAYECQHFLDRGCRRALDLSSGVQASAHEFGEFADMRGFPRLVRATSVAC